MQEEGEAKVATWSSRMVINLSPWVKKGWVTTELAAAAAWLYLPKDGHKTKGTDSFNKLMRTYLWK